MWAYVVRRLLYAIPVLLGVTLITFMLFHVAGGSPARNMAGRNATPERLERIKEEYGLDKSLPQQYFHFLKQVATFDYGRSYNNKQEVTTLILEGAGPEPGARAAGVPLRVAVVDRLGTLLRVLPRIPRRRRDPYGVGGGDVGVEPRLRDPGPVPPGVQVAALPRLRLRVVRAGAHVPVLPAMIWVLLSVGTDVRFFRAVMLEEMRADYVRTGAAKGLSTRTLLFSHVLRNSLIPIITRLVIMVPFLFMGSLLLETFFGIPGIGNLTVNAIYNNDWPVVKAMVVLGAILYVVGVLVSDVLYAIVDPQSEAPLMPRLIDQAASERADHRRRRRGRYLGFVARVLAWPISLSLLLLGLVLRLFGVVGRLLFSLGVLSRAGRHEEHVEATRLAKERLSLYVRQARRYLFFLSDRFPPLVGAIAPGGVEGPWGEAKRRLRRDRLALVSFLGMLLYFYVALFAAFGWIATDYQRGDPQADFHPADALARAPVGGGASARHGLPRPRGLEADGSRHEERALDRDARREPGVPDRADPRLDRRLLRPIRGRGDRVVLHDAGVDPVPAADARACRSRSRATRPSAPSTRGRSCTRGSG